MLRKFKDWMSSIDSEKIDQKQIGDTITIPHPAYKVFEGQSFSVRLGGIDDVDYLLMMQIESYGNEQWHRRSLEQDISYNKKSFYLIMENPMEPVAFVGAWMTDDEVHISNLCVRPKYQKQGIASFLVNEVALIAEEKDKSIYTLEVRVSNESAIRLYKRLGFETVEYKPRYYLDNHEDAYYMLRKLNTLGGATYDSYK